MGREFSVDGDFDASRYGETDKSAVTKQEAGLFNTQEAEVVGIMVRLFGCEAHQVTRDATLESLGADSLDGVELVMELEEHFNIEISDDEASDLPTVADVLKVVAEAVAHEEDADPRRPAGIADRKLLGQGQGSIDLASSDD